MRWFVTSLVVLALAGCGAGGLVAASNPSTGPQPGCSSEACERERQSTHAACTETPRQEEALCISTGGSRSECETNRRAREIEDAEGKPCR
jgi:hypothetical protein